MTTALPAPTTPTEPNKPKGLLWSGIVLLVLSVVITVSGVVVGGVKVASTVSNSTVFRAPGTVDVDLDAGEHALWTPQASSLAAYDITVTGPGATGSQVHVTRAVLLSTTSTITRNGTSYSVDSYFSAPATGRYTITVTGGPASGPSVLVGPGSNFITDTALVIGASILVATLVFLVGLVLLIVGLVRRSQFKRNQQGPPQFYGGPPPGYPSQPPGAYPPVSPPPAYPPSAYPPPTSPPASPPWPPQDRPPYGQPPYGQPPYGQPPYGQPSYGQPPDHRPPGTPPPRGF